MADTSFRAGQLLRWGTTVHRIVEKHGPLLVLEHSVTLERRVHDESSILLEYVGGKIVPVTEVDEQQVSHGAVSPVAADRDFTCDR